MTLLPLLLAVGLVAPAHAGKKADKAGVRVKFNAPLYTMSNNKYFGNGEEAEDFADSSTALTFLTGQNRTEVTKLIGDGLEVGGILGFDSYNYKDNNGDSTGKMGAWNIGITGAYNIKASDGLVIYVQPIVMYGKGSLKDADGELVGGANNFAYALDVGARINLAKGIHIDPALEYLGNTSTAFDADKKTDVDEDGEKDAQTKTSNIGLRLGLGVKF